jgi:hypothetical protein
MALAEMKQPNHALALQKVRGIETSTIHEHLPVQSQVPRQIASSKYIVHKPITKHLREQVKLSLATSTPS